MKKFLNIFVLVIMFFSFGVKAEEVTLKKCIDGDTADFNINGKVKKVRFLAIDAPEIKHGDKKADPYGEDASLFTCMALKTANKVTLEYESKNNTDKYGRVLAWVFVDDKLLQGLLVKKGYAKVAYLYGDYKYTDKLKKYESEAKSNKLNIWSDYKEDYTQYLFIGIIGIIVLIVCIFDKSYRKKTARKIKRKVRKSLDKEVDKLLK
ncbi:MAG: thermonuclease family protein [Bacilli bacterium]|nr:thermonuclease family protein [Bacilli bacterium]